jgi:chromosomal replication initiator protein
MNADQSWQAALGQLQMEMPRATFDTWVRDAELLACEDGTFIVGVQNAYARDWLESRLTGSVKRVLSGIVGRSVEIRFIVWQGESAEDETLASLPAAPSKDRPVGARVRLNPRYQFETFVVGPSNRLAHAATQAVAESPARSYNPLFLYGGVGLGKTHLLHAVGNACAGRGLNVLYVTSEEFTNDLINDIQFIAGKESTQEEFFHTFNALHGQDKQLVISSDRPPKALVTLEERLRSRFEWGLTADIQPPDFETRVAILRSKAERAGRQVEPQFLEMIARRVQSNIRELEGALTRVLAFSDLSEMPMTPELVENTLTKTVCSAAIARRRWRCRARWPCT